MEIQKEREAFEQHLTDTGLVEFAGYGFAVDECDEYLHEPTQVAWDSWLIGLNRTKAQAVQECTWSRNEDYYFDTSCGNSFMFTECEDKPSEHQFKHCCYCGGKLIEAQEQSHENG